VKTKRLARDSLFVRLATIITIVVVSIISLHAAVTYINKKHQIIAQMQTQSKQTILLLQKSLAHFIESYSINEYEQLLYNAVENSDIFALTLDDFNMGQLLGREAYTTGYIHLPNQKISTIDSANPTQQKLLKTCYYRYFDYIYAANASDKKIAKVSICFSDQKIQNELDQIVYLMLFNALITSIVLIVSLFFALNFLIIVPISRVVSAIKKSDAQGIPLEPIAQNHSYEIDILVQSINQMIASIRDSQLKLRAIIRNIPDLLWIKDSKGYYLACNRRFEAFFGAKEQEIVGKSDYDFIDKELADFFKKHDDETMNDIQPRSNFEKITFANDGHTEYLQTTKTKILDHNGQLYGILGIGRDITAMRNYQQEIEQQKRELQTILDTTKEGIAIIDLTTQFLFANQAYLHMVGLSKEELLRKKCIDMSLPEDIKPFQEALAKVLKRGFIEGFERDYYTADQQKLKINISIALMPAGQSFLIVTRDVTQLRQKEKLLNDYVQIIDHNVITSSTDLQGDITEVSQAFCSISGYTKEELIGKNHRLVRHDDTPISSYQKLWQALQNNRTWTGEIKNRKKDGTFYWVASTIAPIFDIDNRKIGYTAISQDITDRKIIEEISITDGLTQIYNRRYFNKMLPKVINRAKRDNSVVCFLIMDVDFFKQYNDTYGHQKGDEVLIKLAQSLQSHIKRADDFCFRLGGEEFGIILKSDNYEHTINFAHKIRANIENLHIEHQTNPVSQYITVSMGLICKPAHDIGNEKELYTQADNLLYQAKESGRNQVCHA